jgi:hypothetical protein
VRRPAIEAGQFLPARPELRPARLMNGLVDRPNVELFLINACLSRTVYSP